MRFLEERDIGLPVRSARVPIVTRAVLFDLLVGDASARPDADVVEARSGTIVAGARRPDGSGWHDAGSAMTGELKGTLFAVASTTLAVVATDALLTKEQASAIAMMAHDGIARATRPSHTMFDGDTVFVLASGRVGAADLTSLGHTAAELVAEAIVRGVHAADGLGGVPSLHDLS